MVRIRLIRDPGRITPGKAADEPVGPSGESLRRIPVVPVLLLDRPVEIDVVDAFVAGRGYAGGAARVQSIERIRHGKRFAPAVVVFRQREVEMRLAPQGSILRDGELSALAIDIGRARDPERDPLAEEVVFLHREPRGIRPAAASEADARIQRPRVACRHLEIDDAVVITDGPDVDLVEASSSARTVRTSPG